MPGLSRRHTALGRPRQTHVVGGGEHGGHGPSVHTPGPLRNLLHTDEAGRLLLDHGLSSLSGVLLRHLRGHPHLLLHLLLLLLLLLMMLLFLGEGGLLHVLEPQLGQVDLTWVFARVNLTRRERRAAHQYVRRLGWRGRLLDHKIT